MKKNKHYYKLLERCNVENKPTEEEKERIKQIASSPEVIKFLKKMYLKYM